MTTSIWKTLLLLGVCCCCSTFLEAKEKSGGGSYLLKKPQCTEKRQKHLESEMAKALPIGGRSNKRFPETVAEVQVYCR